VGAIVALAVVATLVLLPPPIANAVAASDRSVNANPTLRTLVAALLVALVLGWVAATAYLVVIDGTVRSVLMGALVAVAAFQLVHRVGVWRWEVHDREERSDARINRQGPEGRRWLFLEAAVLLIITGGLAVAVTAGSLTLVGMLAIGLLIGIVVVIARDAAAVGTIA
jgi:hypothetical protein